MDLGSRLAVVEIATLIAVLAPNCGTSPCEGVDCNTGGGGEAGGGAGPGGAGGDGGVGASGGDGGQGGTATTTSGDGGQGGVGGCQPASDPCQGAVCGSADDGCGNEVACGPGCGGAVCVDGQCCQPKTCADFPGACDGAQRDDGCGGTILCGDAVCGDGQWMSCKTGNCACALATDFPNAAQSQAACNDKAPGTFAYYCGEPVNEEAPVGCEYLFTSNGAVPGNPRVWCCP